MCILISINERELSNNCFESFWYEINPTEQKREHLIRSPKFQVTGWTPQATDGKGKGKETSDNAIRVHRPLPAFQHFLFPFFFQNFVKTKIKRAEFFQI